AVLGVGGADSGNQGGQHCECDDLKSIGSHFVLLISIFWTRVFEVRCVVLMGRPARSGKWELFLSVFREKVLSV
ncbi:MAG: hypothetical protein KC561_17915, partial [Myxococcales bacterium]|nr:hypothetical protein [Myxococcales bacterium]